METNNELDDVLKTYTDAMEALKRVTADGLLAAFARRFEANPAVKCAIWTQYTPYFNDGDPCTFGVHFEECCRSRMPKPGELDDWTVLVGCLPDGDEAEYPPQKYEAEFLDAYEYRDAALWRSYDDPPTEASAQADAMESFINGLPDDLMSRVIGDGVKVFVWAGGILTTDYQHD